MNAPLSEEQKTGMESAFPMLDHNGNNLIMREPGLTKRELFAAMAMQGLLTHQSYHNVSRELTAEEAVLQADALLKELSR